MKNTNQGIFIATNDGTIDNDYSEILETIFETKCISGKDAIHFLFSQSDINSKIISQVSTVLETLIGSNEIMFEFNRHLLLSTLDIKINNNIKHLKLNWHPITENKEIAKFMITVQDITNTKLLETETENQKEELEKISQILSISPLKFDKLIKSSFEHIDTNRSLINEKKFVSPELTNKLFKNIRTLKNNAKAHGLTHIAENAHTAETSYDKLRSNPTANWSHKSLSTELEKLRTSVATYKQINKNILKRENTNTRSPAKEMLHIEKSKIEEIKIQLLSIQSSQISTSTKNSLAKLSELIDLLDACTLRGIAEGAYHALDCLAEEQGKPSPSININANGVVIKQQAQEILNTVFMHNFRNSINHGIETPETRVKKGKPPEGRITVDASIQGNNTLSMRLHDDGQGIRVKSDKDKAIEAGMDTLKELITEQGGEISIHLLEDSDINIDSENEDQNIPFELLITLPENLYIQKGY